MSEQDKQFTDGESQHAPRVQHGELHLGDSLTPRNNVKLSPEQHKGPRPKSSILGFLRPTIRGGLVTPTTEFESAPHRIVLCLAACMKGHRQQSSIWSVASAHTMQILPAFCLEKKLWSEGCDLMCNFVYVTESVRTLGLGTTQDSFHALGAACTRCNQCPQHIATRFAQFASFVREAGNPKFELSTAYQLATSSDHASLNTAAQAFSTDIRELIATTEDRMSHLSSPTMDALGSSDAIGNAAHLLTLLRANGSDILPRPWKARLCSLLDHQTISMWIQPSSHTIPVVGEALEFACQEMLAGSHRHNDLAYLNEQREASTQVISMILERVLLIEIVGASGYGKSAVLLTVRAGLEDLKTDQMQVVVYHRMEWHTALTLRRHLVKEIMFAVAPEQDYDTMSLVQAFECIPRDQSFVLLLDGLSLPEKIMVKSAVFKVQSKHNVVVVFSSNQRDYSPTNTTSVVVSLSSLGLDDGRELVSRKAESFGLVLSDKQISDLVGKQESGSPQYLVFAAAWLTIQCNDSKAERIATMPETLEDLISKDGGVLTLLESSFGASFVRAVFFWFSFVSSTMRLDDVRSLLSFQVSALPDPFWNDFESTFARFVRQTGSLSSVPLALLEACRRRYGWDHQNGAGEFSAYQAYQLHLQFETDHGTLQTLVDHCRQFAPDDPAVARAGSWLDAAARLVETTDMLELRQLVEACGPLSGSSDLDDAKLRLQISEVLGTEKDLERIATLCSGYADRLTEADAATAKRWLVCERRLEHERHVLKVSALVTHLDGFTGPHVDEARRRLASVDGLQRVTDVADLRAHLSVCGDVTGSDVVDDANRLLDIDQTIGSALLVDRLAEHTTLYHKVRAARFPLLTPSENLRRAEAVLEAADALQRGEGDITQVRAIVDICHGVAGSEALERARTALVAESELATIREVNVLKGTLDQCSFLSGSAVLDHKRQVMECEKRLRSWVPFALMQSFAEKLKGTMGSADCRGRIQTLFAEIDTDQSGYITQGEMEAALERLGVQMSPVDTANLMQGMDADGTGEIDQLEFISFVEALIARSDAVSSEEEELKEIGRLIDGIQDDLDGSEAVEDARFKLVLNTALHVNDFSWLTDFFAANAEKLVRCRLTAPKIAEKKQWIKAEGELAAVLRKTAHVVRPTLPKRELWAAVQACGELENSTTLLRARRIMDTEKALMFENVAARIREMLKVCGLLIGSPAVQRARSLLSAEFNLERTMSGVHVATIEQIKLGIQQCHPLEQSEVLDEARVAVASEVVLEHESRSAALRRILPLCESVRGSKVLDRCRKLVQIEDSLSELADEMPPKYDLSPCDMGMNMLHLIGKDVHRLLIDKARSFHVSGLRLSKSITDADVLRQKISLVGTTLTQSLVLDQALQVTAALDSLPWTEALDEMSHVRDAIIKHLGSKYLSPERQSARLKQIFEEFDDDRSGSVDKDEIDKAFFQLGVHINSWDLDKLMQTYDTDGTGEIEFDEFEQMVELMIRGAKWHNSTDLTHIRDLLSTCGYLKSGRQTEWLFLAQKWLVQEARLASGISDHAELSHTVEACGPVTGSVAIDHAVSVLRAACELQVAVTDAQIHDLMAVCGHLQGLPVLELKRAWLEAEESLLALHYHMESTEWRPSSHASLWRMVERCGDLVASPALSHAMSALQAETDLGRTHASDDIRRLLGVCGHLTESKTIDDRRAWIEAENALKDTCDLTEIRALCATCSDLQGSFIVDTALQLLEVESGLATSYSEESLRAGLAALEGKITGSDNMRAATLRFQKFSMRRQALNEMYRAADAAALTDSLQTLLLCSLFDSLDVGEVGHLTFKDIRSALQALGIQPNVDSIGAATALFDVPDTTALSIFLHLALGSFGDDTPSLVDATVIVETMHAMRITPAVGMVEEVMSLLTAGEPEYRIYFAPFKEFMCKQMEENGLDVKMLRSRLSDFRLPKELECKIRWIDAELQLVSCVNYQALLLAIDKCGALTGSKALEDAREIVDAAKDVAFAPDLETMKRLLSRCGHLEACPTVTEAKSFIVMERWLSEASDYATIKFYLHACAHLNSPAITAAKSIVAKHDSLFDHILEGRTEHVLATIGELCNSIGQSDVMKLGKCSSAVGSFLMTDRGSFPGAQAVSRLVDALSLEFGVALRDYHSVVCALLHLQTTEGGVSLDHSQLSKLWDSLHGLQKILMDKCRMMKGVRPSAPTMQVVFDETLLLNQWRLVLDPFLSGECKDVNPRVLSSYLKLSLDTRSWSRCAELVTNLFYLRSRIFDVGVPSVLADLSRLLESAASCRQIHPSTMRRLYAAVWFCDSRKHEIVTWNRLLPIALKGVGMHRSCHDSKSTFSSAQFAQEGSHPQVSSEPSLRQESRALSGLDDSSDGGGTETLPDSTFPQLTVNGYGELFSLHSLEVEIQQEAQSLLERAKAAIIKVELLSTAFRPDGELAGKKAVLRARDTIRDRHFLRVVCSLGLEEALADKSWARRLQCVLEDDALHEPLKLHAHAAYVDEYMDTVLDAVSSDVVNWEMGDVFLSVSDVWQSWIHARWHRSCLAINVQNDVSTKMGKRWMESVLVGALSGCSTISRGAFEVESLSDDAVLVEVTNREDIRNDVAALQQQLLDTSSSFHEVCDRNASLAHRPGIWQYVKLAICDPCGLDEEIAFLTRFVLPALSVKCQREGLKVSLDWQVMRRSQLAGPDECWENPTLPASCSIGAPPGDDGTGRPFFVLLSGSLEDSDPHDLDAVPVKHLCQQFCRGRARTEGLLAVCSQEEEHRASKHHNSRKQAKQRAVESAFRILQAADMQSDPSSPEATLPESPLSGSAAPQATSPTYFARTKSSHNAKLRNILRMGIFKNRDSTAASPQPHAVPSTDDVSDSSVSPCRSPMSPSRGISPVAGVRPATETRRPALSPLAVSRVDCPMAAAAALPGRPTKGGDLRRDLKGMKEVRFCEYPPNYQRSIERNVIKARDGLLLDDVCRLSDFGLLMMDRLWNTLEAHCSVVAEEQCEHAVHVMAQGRQLQDCRKRIEFSERGMQERACSEVLSRLNQRTSLVRIVGPPGSGKSSVLARLAVELSQNCQVGESVVVFFKMPWHGTIDLVRYLRHELLGDQSDANATLSGMFQDFSPRKHHVLLLDGLNASERNEVAISAKDTCGDVLGIVMTADSFDNASDQDTVRLAPMDLEERRATILTLSAGSGFTFQDGEADDIVNKEDAGLPRYLAFALASLGSQDMETSAADLPGRIDDLVQDERYGILSALEKVHGRDLVAEFFRWFVVYRRGLAVSDLSVLLRERTQCAPIQTPNRPETLQPLAKDVLDALFDHAAWFVETSTCTGDSQTVGYISCPALLRGICARYGCVSPSASVQLEVAIHCDKQIAKETDLRSLKTIFDIIPEFGSTATKRKALSWIEAEKRLTHVNDYNALKTAVASCGKLSGSDELLKAQQAFEAVRKLAYERDVEKVRTLCHSYRIKQSHPNVESARDILKTEAEMVMERRIDVLRKLHHKCQRYHGSATISKVSQILEAEAQLPSLKSFFDLRRCLSVCAGIVDSPHVENAKAVVSAVEHLTLRKQLPKVHFDALVSRVPEAKELLLKYWIVHPRVRPPAMIWNEDTTNTLKRHQNKLKAATSDVQVDPAPILEEFWDAFDEVVMKLAIARDMLQEEEGTLITLEEDHNSIIQDALLKCHFLTDVPIVKIMLRRRQAATDLANERRIAVVQEKLEICGMIRSNRTVDAAKEALKSEGILMTERHVPAIKKLMDKCQWLENSEAVVWAAQVLDRIERMRPFIYTAAAPPAGEAAASLEEGSSPAGTETASDEAGLVPARDLKEFLDMCGSLTGSDVIDRACQMVASIARLEQESDSKQWSDLLSYHGWYGRHPDEAATQTTWDVLEVATLLRVAKPVRGDAVLSKARKFLASSIELTRLITPHINVGVRQLGEVLKRCGPLCGLQTAVEMVSRIKWLHTKMKPEEQEWLEQMLDAWRRPGENVEFVGWEKIVDLLPHILPSSALTEILAACSIERARRCMEALRLIECDDPPVSVPTLERLRAECSNLPMSDKLDDVRAALNALNDLKRIHHIDAVRRAVDLCRRYDGSATLTLAREQVIALAKIETELRRDALADLVKTCERLVGSEILDRDRKWLAADAQLETERRVPRIKAELQNCGDLQGSSNMETARQILAVLETLTNTTASTEVRQLVQYLDSEKVSENAHLDETRTVLELEESLPSRVETIDLVHALIQVDERLTESEMSAAAHVRLHVLLEQEWKTVCTHNTLPVLKKFHELGLEMVMKSGFNYAYLSNLHAEVGKDFMQAWSEVGARLLAIDNLKGETDFKTISSLLKVIGEIKECPLVEEARGWIESIVALETATDAAVVEALVAKSGPVGGSDVLALAKQRVMTLAALEQGDASTFDIEMLREYCALCEHLHGNPFLDKCRAAVAAVDKLKEFDRVGFMHRFTRMWAVLQKPDVFACSQHIFELLNVLERNKEMDVLREAAAPLRALHASDDIRSSRKWLQVLHVSNDFRNETFTVVSKEPRHVTVSQQAEGMTECLRLAGQVTGDELLAMAREAQAFFCPEHDYPEDFLRKVPVELTAGLRTPQRGKQMEGLLALLSAALRNDVYVATCQALDAEEALRAERSVPKIAELVAACDEFTSTVIVQARAMLSAEQRLVSETEYNEIKELLRQCEGCTGSKTLDAARHKVAMVDELEGCVDYFKIRDVVPHVKVTGSEVLADAQWIDLLVREMMATTRFQRLQQILSELRQRRVVGFPEMDRVGELLALEERIEGIRELDELSTALSRIGTRISDSERIDHARSRHAELVSVVGNDSRCSDLFAASFYGNTMAVAYFLEQDPSALHAYNEQSETPLHRACAGGSASAVELLLLHRASPEAAARDGSTALHKAAAGGHVKVVKLLASLVPKRIDATATVLEQTALHFASKGGHAAAAQALLDANADIDAQDANGNTPIMGALAAGQRETAKLLCQRKCSLRVENCDGYTCLHLAARQGYSGLVSKCVRLGLSVSARTRGGYGALHMAAMAGAADLCAYLLRKCGEVNGRDGWGSTALHHASRAGSVAAVEVLLMAGGDPRIRNAEGRGWRALDVSTSDAVNAMLYKGLYPRHSNLDNLPVAQVEEEEESRPDGSDDPLGEEFDVGGVAATLSVHSDETGRELELVLQVRSDESMDAVRRRQLPFLPLAVLRRGQTPPASSLGSTPMALSSSASSARRGSGHSNHDRAGETMPIHAAARGVSPA